MLRPFLISFLYILLLSCNNKQQATKEISSNDKKLYRFYDFDVIMEVYNPNGTLQSKYFILNSGMEHLATKNLNGNTLYYIEHLHSTNMATDTVQVPLEKPQLDSIYSLGVATFDIEPKENLAKDSIPPPPVAWDGDYAQVQLNLGYRGAQQYQTYGKANKDGGDKVSNLYQYFLKLKSNR